MSLAWKFIRDEPAAWVQLMVRKAALFWNHVEMIDTEDVYTYSEFAWPLHVPGQWLNLGVVAVLGVVGLCVGWRRYPGTRLLCVLIATYWASVSAFYVVARYRMPVVPLLMLLAGVGLVDGWGAWRSSSRLRRLIGLTAVTATTILCALPLVDRARQQTGTRLNFGAELLDRGRAEEAAAEFRTALAINPNFLEAQYNLGRAYVEMGRLGDAAIYFAQALDRDPTFAEAALNLGNVSLELGDTEGAITVYQHALRLAPHDGRVWYGLGTTYAIRGEWDRAVEALEEAVRLAPGHSAAQENLLRAKAMRDG
jgi:Tfp pilus assembly protein PilF